MTCEHCGARGGGDNVLSPCVPGFQMTTTVCANVCVGGWFHGNSETGLRQNDLLPQSSDSMWLSALPGLKMFSSRLGNQTEQPEV